MDQARNPMPPAHAPNAGSTTAPSSRASERAAKVDTLTLSLREHGVGFFVPPGATMQSARLVMPYGALISGTFIGDLICEAGSVIITKGGMVCGSIVADRVYIEGDVASSKSKRSLVTGRALVAASSTARINGDLKSAAFAIHKPQLWGQLISVDEPAPKSKPAAEIESAAAKAAQRLTA
ncbi:polymer-forming cytoskeletal protein [Pelomonas sp. APW6]|uniref:Polymer-forming cytoskeletal protein n=1 Tax=Roseateles subflavus TaxID=3053353 RepID=A0ABT7LPL7_9BURK|nr:polymer-forming cytoskeletal protein [Pelomonas sp. APW6]MDL5034374.1 polymer-forming cytoskeletal protein [Pelomonas sp. APW6]